MVASHDHISSILLLTLWCRLQVTDEVARGQT